MTETRAKTTQALEEHIKRQDLQLLEIGEWKKQIEDKINNWGNLMESKVEHQALQLQTISTQLGELMKMAHGNKGEPSILGKIPSTILADNVTTVPVSPVKRAFEIATVQEQTLEFTVKMKLSNSGGGKPFTPTVRAPHVIRNNQGNTSKPNLEGFKRLSPQEIQYRRNNNLCWKCGDKWGPGHLCKLKQVSVITMEKEEDSGTLQLLHEEMEDAGKVLELPQDQLQAITQMDTCWL
ncbi:OLC1v1014310C1 [Oldenlandia corymbosa var. corymbosa]|uniref:OLC1v1014310C1 n=1 Tax=Oldenlandia corymbosa var. corymbosa TaxID=529605 RepID=A0AAV1E0R6_OLDCO|nr:OLC1v1014310C1 [Oldenlandia corymbosa var. corymbosa]